MSFHKRRVWGVSEVDACDDAALRKLARDICEDGNSWTLCSAWRLGKYLLLNDSTSEDGAGEWCVCVDDGPECEYRDIESITFSWCDEEKALAYLREILAGKYDDECYGLTERSRVEEEHGYKHGRPCHLCA